MKNAKYFIFIFIAFMLMSHWFRWGYDDTDNWGKRQRSGMALYTDHATGKQYLSGGWFGGITPRINANGEHMSVKEE